MGKTNSTDNQINTEYCDLIIEVYKSRVKMFHGQGDRLWRRFYIFFLADIGLLSFYFSKIAISDDLGIGLAIIGFIFSLIWYIIAAGDSYF